MAELPEKKRIPLDVINDIKGDMKGEDVTQDPSSNEIVVKVRCLCAMWFSLLSMPI